MEQIDILYKTVEQTIRQYEEIHHVDKNVIESDVRHAIRWVMRDNPDIFWFAHQYHYDEASSTIHFQYTFSVERVKTIQQSINDVIENDFCIEYVKKLSQQEQVVYVYKWLVSYCNYNVNSAYNQNIYSIFVRRNSVCTGYAKAAQYLFNLLGIESRLVFGRLHNDKEDGRHCWNLVKVNNKYYHFDACFGDSILDNVAFQSGVQELFKIDGINYNFLCVSTDEILKSRSIEDIETLPECSISWSRDLIISLVGTEIKKREEIKGCLLSHIGSSADIYLCTKDKNTVLKVFRPYCKTTSQKEFHYMQQLKGCHHLLQCNEDYTNISQNIVAIEQSTPIIDLLCSHYYELSLKGLIKIVTDIALAWKECQELGVLYRDIHVCNIYRSNDGTFKLGDFGSCTNNFNIKETVGNQWFMAPETFVSGIFTEASAVYSISMVMYFILNNLRPAFWAQGCEDEALQKRMRGDDLPIPAGCLNLPSYFNIKLDVFFRKTSASFPKERISSIEEFISELEKLTCCCGGLDYVIHCKGVSLTFDLEEDNNHRLYEHWNYIPCDTEKKFAISEDDVWEEVMRVDTEDSYRQYMSSYPDGKYRRIAYELLLRLKGSSRVMGDEVERICLTTYHPSENSNPTNDINNCFENISDGHTTIRHIAHADEVETFATTMYGSSVPSYISLVTNITNEVESYSSTMKSSENKIATYNAIVQKSEESIWCKLFGNKYNEVYSSIFAPAEVKRKSHLQVQVYLHLYEESEKVKSLAKESDKNAERRDYIPLSLKLKKGDKVDVEFNVYGETRLMSECKSIIWQGSFTKCSFDYFVPNNLDVDELSCVANIFVNGAMIGEMRFLTQIVEVPRNLNPEILSKAFKKIFISYAHKDFDKVKFMAKAYKAQGVDYFFDRDYLKAGDIYPKKIKDYIDTSDLFILCWSQNAAESEYVEKEKLQALSLSKNIDENNGTLTIHPLSIEPRAELPSDMKDDYNFEVI